MEDTVMAVIEKAESPGKRPDVSELQKIQEKEGVS